MSGASRTDLDQMAGDLGQGAAGVIDKIYREYGELRGRKARRSLYRAVFFLIYILVSVYLILGTDIKMEYGLGFLTLLSLVFIYPSYSYYRKVSSDQKGGANG